MTNFYYALIVIFIFAEAVALFDSGRLFKEVCRMRKIIKEKRRSGVDMTADDYCGGMLLYNVFQVVYLLYCLVGLMSSQYMLFSVILLMGLIPKKRLWLFRVDAAITMCILLFIMLNKYHFHINLYHLIFS